MGDPKPFSAPVTAFDDDTASTDKMSMSPKKSQDDNERTADSEPSENRKDSSQRDGTEVDTVKPADLEANVLKSFSASNSDQEQKSDETFDPNIVDWDGPNDPSNPINWPQWKVKTHIFLVSAITFIR